MSQPSRLPAVLVYLIPVIGWLYVFLFQRRNELAVYHLRQSIGLAAFLIAVVAAWGVIAWLITWIPYFAVLGMALFTIVIAAYTYGALAWIMGIINALSSKLTPLPIFGRWADRLPIT